MAAHKTLSKCRSLPPDYDHAVLDETETLMLSGMGESAALRKARRNVAARRARTRRLRAATQRHEARG